MRLLSRILGRTPTERGTNATAVVDQVPHAGVRVDDDAREGLAAGLGKEQTRRDALRLGVAAGGGILAVVLADRLVGHAGAAPGDAVGGTTISDTDIDAKRIAGIRVSTEFAATKHSGTDADPWPGSAIQAALDDLPASGGLAFVPFGTYNVSSPLRITKSNVALLGAGFASHLKTDGLGFTANSSGMIEIDGAYKGVSVEGLYLNGTNTDTCRGLIVTGGSEVLVRNSAFVNWLGILSQRGRGLTVVHNPGTELPPHKGVRVEGCYFWNNQIGAVFHRCLYTFINCYVEQNIWDGIYCEGTARGLIANNLITFQGRSGMNIIFTERHSILGNRVEDCAAGITVYQARTVKVLGNDVERCSGAGIEVRASSSGCVVANNGVVGCQDGILVLDSDHVRVAGNRCISNGFGVHASGATDFLIIRENDLRGNTTAKALVGANLIVSDNWES